MNMITSARQVREGPLRVVHVAGQLEMGGMEKLLVEFARHADRDRFSLMFISLSGRSRIADEIEACGWPVIALEEPPGLRPRIAIRLARHLRRHAAHVVHTHNARPLLYGGVAARLAGIGAGVVHTRHGQDIHDGLGRVARLGLTARLTDRLVCVSQDAARLSMLNGTGWRQVCTIFNGVDLQRFSYAGPEPAGPVVAVSRLSPEKDVATLVRAAAIAVGQQPSLYFEIAGDGECREQLEGLIADLGLEGSVRLLGEVGDVPALLRRASAFVLASLTEGISLTLLEAMARGLPVVATRVGGTPEVVADGQTGILVPANQPAALAAALVALHRAPDTGRRMGLVGRSRCERYFDARRMVAEYESLYAQVAAGRDPMKVPA